MQISLCTLGHAHAVPLSVRALLFSRGSLFSFIIDIAVMQPTGPWAVIS